jgi:[acyl-carrier-protein] S-malonyltransferase
VRVAVVFPGQGTQEPGMARAWKGHRSWSVVEAAEDALGESLAQLVLDAPVEQLARTRDAQLAVLTTSLIAFDAARERLDGHEIVAYAGHSLGQVTALIGAGVLALADGVRFAARRAEATQRAADERPGRMAALLGATEEQATAACEGIDCWVANDNAPGQIVIAGTPEGLDAAVTRARELGVRRATPLKVGGAFHTPLMESAVDALRTAIADVELHAPSAPVVSNGDAVAYSDGEGWRARLLRHPTEPVRWRASMETLAGPLGAQRFVEVGHGSMIAGVAKRTVPDVTVVGVHEPDDLARLQEELA